MAEVEPPRSTVIVLTTLSLAVKPVMSAVEIRQSPRPRGRKMGAIQLPHQGQQAVRRVSDHVELQVEGLQKPDNDGSQKDYCKSLVAKSLAFSPMSRRTFFAPGIR